MKRILFFLLLAPVLFSCEKEPDELNVTINQSGTLAVRVTDGTSYVSRAKVGVYSSVPENQRIYFDSTDAAGTCDVGELLQGQYRYYVYAEKENRVYMDSEYFQVIAGKEKVVEANPFANVGSARVQILDYWNNEPLAGVNVALVPEAGYYIDGLPFQEILHKAYFHAKTDADGWVQFNKVPAGTMGSVREYGIMAYYDNYNYDVPSGNNNIYVSQGDERSYVMHADLY